MNLYLAIERYLTLKQSLGAVFAAEARILWMLSRAVGDISLEELTPESCSVFCRGNGPPTRWWERKHYTLRGFFAFVVSRGHLDASPLIEKAPKSPRTFEPYIYSREELERLLDATEILESDRSPLQPTTFRVLLLVLYAAGLRPGEGLRLRCCDVDLGSHVLAIWDTKFFKSRFVPIGQQLGHVLESYRTKRLALPMPEGQHSAFFPTVTGVAIRLKWLERVFARLRGEAGVSRPAGTRWQPRLHDLRHAFAVHRLIAWYREGADVQALLPVLATYLGHINVSSTQAYLSMTSELLAEASRRFDVYAAIGRDGLEHGH
jgi:site-specific recombinase XerD